MTPAEIEVHFHPVLRPVAQRTQELLEPMHAKVHARPGVADIDKKGEFSEHWSSSLRELCEIVYGDTREQVRSLLEIGAYEGRSTVFFATFFPNARIDTIDTFAGSDEHKFVPAASRTEGVFDRNMATFTGRIKKHKGYSYDHLPRLRASGSQFDAAFIDGSHFSDDIYVDTFYAWAMLKPGGVLIWDDYLWSEYKNPLGDPRAAIDRFLEVHQGAFEPLFAGWQVAVRKKTVDAARAFRQG
jgi:predicted O-methyltransferase YrrM